MPDPLEVELVLKEDEMPLDEQISKQMQQNFANENTLLMQTASRFNDGSAFVAQESKQSFLLQQRVIGAAAVNQLERDGLADLTMQLKSAGNYPPNTHAQA